jgi:ureidoacrylate peracid hydrolase
MDLANLRHKVAPERSALIIIDMQKDYCAEGGAFHRMGYDIEPAKALAVRVNGFLSQARKVLKNVVHFKMTKIDFLGSPAALEQYKRLGINRQYDPTFSEFYEVVPKEGEVVIPKYRHSAFVSTYFDQFLRIRQIQTLILTGLATNVCVESTARDGFARDYHIVIPEDLTEGTSPEAKKWSLNNINSFFGEIVQSEDLLKCWDVSQPTS